MPRYASIINILISGVRLEDTLFTCPLFAQLCDETDLRGGFGLLNSTAPPRRGKWITAAPRPIDDQMEVSNDRIRYGNQFSGTPGGRICRVSCKFPSMNRH